jgi:hypothetical protein
MKFLDSGFRRNDKIRPLLTFYDFIFSCACKKDGTVKSTNLVMPDLIRDRHEGIDPFCAASKKMCACKS